MSVVPYYSTLLEVRVVFSALLPAMMIFIILPLPASLLGEWSSWSFVGNGFVSLGLVKCLPASFEGTSGGFVYFAWSTLMLSFVILSGTGMLHGRYATFVFYFSFSVMSLCVGFFGVLALFPVSLKLSREWHLCYEGQFLVSVVFILAVMLLELSDSLGLRLVWTSYFFAFRYSKCALAPMRDLVYFLSVLRAG